MGTWFSHRRCAAAGLLLLAGSALAWAQDFVVRTVASPPPAISVTLDSGKSDARVIEITPTPELLILLSPDALTPEDLAPVQTFAIALFQELRSKVPVRIGVISGGSVDVAGPIRSVQEIRTALRAAQFDTFQPKALDAAALMSGITASLESVPSEWAFTLIAGHMPQTQNGPVSDVVKDPDVEKYAIAYMARQLIARKRSLLFWDPSAAPMAAWTRMLSRNTGGFAFDQPAELAAGLLSQETLAGITPNLQPPRSGFRLDSVAIDAVPELAGAPTPLIVSSSPAIPAISQFAELRTLTGHIASALADQNAPATALAGARDDLDKALRINPADWTAVSLGITLTERQKDAAAEIPLLEQAVELKPAEAPLWQALGNLQYDRKDFVPAEASLLRARQLGIKNARIAGQLGRIRYESKDYAGAQPLIDESLSLDATQQPLWFLAAGMAKTAGNTGKQAVSLERALALGGLHIEERVELIRIYLAKGDDAGKANAARNADLELPNLPAEPGIQTTWAEFYQQLGRSGDALALWKKALELDPKREPAHAAIAKIFLDGKRYADALDAAEHGIEYAPESPRLQLAKAIALEHLDRIYEARHALDAFTPKTEDVDLLKHQAGVSDVFGGNAPAAYRRLAEALGNGGSDVLKRGWQVSLRDGDDTAAAWFESKMPASERSEKRDAASTRDAKQSNGVWIPGGFDALMFMAHGPAGSSPERFILDYCRTVLVNEPNPNQTGINAFRKSMDEYFAQLKTLLSMGVKTGDQSVITLSMADKKSEKQTETVLALLGWRLRGNKQQLTIESNEKESQARKQDLSAALAIDQGGMQSAFQAGKPFRIEIPWEWAPLAMDEPIIRQLAQAERLAGGLPEAFVVNPDLARFYTGMTNLNRETATALMSSISPVSLAGRYAGLFAFYSSALAVNGGRVLAPGGTQADAVWTSLAGVPPSDPTRFFQALFGKDDGKLFAFFNALSQLDSAHQRFFTLSAKRAGSFYQLFSESNEVRVGRRSRRTSFAGFLRDIPLNADGTVNFPGSAEVWTVARGESKTSEKSEKMLRKVRKAVAPDVEDEILLRIASTRYKIGADHTTELDNFLAVAHIDAHRKEPLDEESALLLAQNLIAFGSFYPYFSVFPDLTAADFKAVFALGARLNSMGNLDADLAMGQFFALVEMIRLGLQSEKLQEQRALTIFRSLYARFQAAQDAAGFAAASLDSVRDLIGAASDADQALATMTLGDAAPLAFEWNDVEHSLDPGHRRAVAFGRVLNLQKAPSVSTLLSMDLAARSVAEGKGAAEPMIAQLVKGAAALPVAEIPKTDKLEGHAKQAIERYSTARLPAIIVELREKAQKKKVDPKDLEKLAREILVELGPQIRLALTGIVYGAYFSPEDTLVANDPLLLRKHESFDLHTGSPKAAFVMSSMELGSTQGGSYALGGFAYFAHASGDAAALGVQSGNPAARLYSFQTAATRMTPWARYRDEDQRLLGLKIRLAREWIVYAAGEPALLRDLSDDTLGVLSLSRRRELLNAIASRDWRAAWNSVSLSDLLILADRYTARYKRSPWNSPVDAALRDAGAHNDGSRLNLLGTVPLSLFGCNHPHLLTMAPYEEYENHLLPDELAERTAEIKLYLSTLMDKLGLPAAALQTIAEPATKIAFRSIRMSDDHDWAPALAAFRAIDQETIEAVLEAAK
jgi:Flp pilus assembly protein TadD